MYKAYIDTAVGKELVAAKTGKGMYEDCSLNEYNFTACINTALFSTNDIERMVKEVSTMLNFKHPNVMSLIGVCLDGEMPLIIMPFMSNGSILEFVKSHREEMYNCSHDKMELVCVFCDPSVEILRHVKARVHIFGIIFVTTFHKCVL